MTPTTQTARFRGKGRGLAGPACLTCPLDVIAGDQLRARRMCEDLDRIAMGPMWNGDLTRMVLRVLDESLHTHLRDAAEDLFPLLRRRCPPEDEIARAMARIGTDLEVVRDGLPSVRMILARCLDAARVPTAPEADRLACFTMHTRRHLMAQNAIILPLARNRLTAHDLQSLAMRMQQRRTVPPHAEPPQAR